MNQSDFIKDQHTSNGGPNRRQFLYLGAATLGSATFLKPSLAGATTPPVEPVSGIYALFPPDSFFGTTYSKSTFYNTAGLDGVIFNPSWSAVEGAQDSTASFVSAIRNPLRAMFSVNANMKFALGIGAGWNAPLYLLNDISYGGNPNYLIANLILQNPNGSPQAFPFPFDPGYVSCYLTMLTNVLNYLASTPIVVGSSIMMISRMTSLKLSLYTGGDLEITIPSWLPGETNPSEAQLWHDAFITPGCLQNGGEPYANNSNWPTYEASQWQTVVEDAWFGFVSSVATLVNTTLDLPGITFSAPMYSPGDAFPKIDGSGNVMNSGSDNSAFAFGLMTGAATASNPFVVMYQALGLDISTMPASLVYNSEFNTYEHSGSYETYVAFQTNGWDNGTVPIGGSKAATGTDSGNDVIIDATTTAGCDHFVTLVTTGATVPQGSAVYSPYIELHYSDIAKWGYSDSTNFPNARDKNMIESIHVDIFGS